MEVKRSVLLKRNGWLSVPALAVATAWVVLDAVALLMTLHLLATSDFDGLNNISQVPLALPWWLVVPAPASRGTDAWLTAGFGLLNAGFVYWLLTAIHRWVDARRLQT